MRRRRHLSTQLIAGDPGKDLFAYLFLLVMIFSFMLLMSFDPSDKAQKAPDHDMSGSKSSKSSFTLVTKGQVAKLKLKDSQLFLQYGKTLYDPIKEMKKLEQDNRIVLKKTGNKTQKVLYIQKETQNQVSLVQYLDTFQAFSKNNITIAFAVSSND